MEPENWHVLVVGLPLIDQGYDLGESISVARLVNPLSVFDLAAVGAVGFREWATLEPLASGATAEIISPTKKASLPGYDALNKCWLASALLVLRGFARHLCPAVSGYSWNFIAGHQKQHSETFKVQIAEEDVERAIYHPRDSLPEFQGGLLDYHLNMLIPSEIREDALDQTEADWIKENFQPFNLLASSSERFRFGLEAAVDWRFTKDSRSAMSRLWSGIESILGIKSELVYRISLLASTILSPKGPERIISYKQVKELYNLRSKAVHGDTINNEKLMTGVHQSYELLRLLLLDAVEQGSIRSDDEWLEELLT